MNDFLFLLLVSSPCSTLSLISVSELNLLARGGRPGPTPSSLLPARFCWMWEVEREVCRNKCSACTANTVDSRFQQLVALLLSSSGCARVWARKEARVASLAWAEESQSRARPGSPGTRQFG